MRISNAREAGAHKIFERLQRGSLVQIKCYEPPIKRPRARKRASTTFMNPKPLARRTVRIHLSIRTLAAASTLTIGALAACSNSAATIAATLSVLDAAVRADSASASLDAALESDSARATDAGTISACSALQLPATITLGAGRGQTLAQSLASVRASAKLATTGGADAWFDGDALHVRAGYGATSTVTVMCSESDSATIAVSQTPLAWTKLAEWQAGPDAPQPREYHAFWQDQGDPNRLFIFSGFHYYPQQYTVSNDVWSFDLTLKTWTQIQPQGSNIAPMAGARVASAPGKRGVLFFGGTVAAEGGAIDTPRLLKDIRYNNSSWTIQDAPFNKTAPASYTGSLVYDAKRSRYLSVCGVNVTNRGVNCLVDAYTEAAGFVSVATSPDATTGDRPEPRFGFHYAMDTANDRVVIFAGSSGTRGDAFSGDTWALDLSQQPARWTRLFGAVPEVEKRRNGGWAHDQDANRMFVWGGTPDGRQSISGIQILALDSGHERWVNVDVPSGPEPRTSGQAVYDQTGKRLIMGLGNGDDVYSDLWQLSLP